MFVAVKRGCVAHAYPLCTIRHRERSVAISPLEGSSLNPTRSPRRCAPRDDEVGTREGACRSRVGGLTLRRRRDCRAALAMTAGSLAMTGGSLAMTVWLVAMAAGVGCQADEAGVREGCGVHARTRGAIAAATGLPRCARDDNWMARGARGRWGVVGWRWRRDCRAALAMTRKGRSQ